jgi:hypothetical protein
MLEIMAVSIALGVIYSSWYVFGGELIGLLICLAIPPISALLCFALAVGMGYMAYSIMRFFEASDGATCVVTGLIGLAALGANIAGAEFMQDISE